MAGKNGAREEKRRDALAILTDDELRAGLRRRRALLVERLADVEVDRLMPGWAETPPEEKERHAASTRLLSEAVAEIDRRLEGASQMLRDFSGRGLGEGAELAG
jgi:hypothetical protein